MYKVNICEKRFYALKPVSILRLRNEQDIFRDAARTRSRYSDSLLTGRSGARIPVGARFSATVQTGPWDLPILLYNGYRIFPGGKAARAWR